MGQCLRLRKHSRPSYLDRLILIAALRERGCSYVAKSELSQAPQPRVFLQAISTDFVDRADIRQGVEDASRLAEALRAAARAEILRRYGEPDLAPQQT